MMPAGKNIRILVVGGSSGGHIFPAVSFIEEYLAAGSAAEVLFVLPDTALARQIQQSGCKVILIPWAGIAAPVTVKNARIVLQTCKGIWRAVGVLYTSRPNIVVGFGGSMSIPFIIGGRLLGAHTLIHEQNVIPGRANRFLTGWTNRIAVSFTDTVKYFAACPEKIMVTGNPLRRVIRKIDKNKALGFFGFTADKITFLVMGGSQGSRRINTAFVEAVKGMAARAPLQVIHLCGAADYDMLKGQYQGMPVAVRLFPFYEQMHAAYSASDLVISRAGATSIAEIIFFNLPAILIPYPFAYQHQLANARVLQQRGAGILMDDEELPRLSEIVEPLIHHQEQLEQMRLAYNDFPENNAGKLLVRAVANFN